MKKYLIKQKLKELDNLTLPNKEKILGSFVIETKSSVSVQNRFKFKYALVASFVLLLIFSYSGYAIVTEAKEYKRAITFFSEYNLDTNGLSRVEIKKVYADIVNSEFSYSKTAKVIEKSVGGYEIFQNAPTSYDLESLWEYKNKNDGGLYYLSNLKKDDKGVSYRQDEIYSIDKKHGIETLEKSILVKSVNGVDAWEVELDAFYIEGHTIGENVVIVYGSNYTGISNQKLQNKLAMISNDGKILWEKTCTNGFKDEYITDVVIEDDGLAVFSRGDFKYLCLTKYDINGNFKSFVKNEISNLGIWNAVKYKDGYLVRVGGFGSDFRIIRMNSDGTLCGSFVYTTDAENYYITDMIEFDGNAYLSAYAVPKTKEGEHSSGNRGEITTILDYIFDNDYLDISNSELTKLVRDNYTATLLVCDMETGDLKEFYSVKGSIGSKLIIDGDKLIWDVESITDTYLSLATSSFSIAGASYIYKYTFDNEGKILSQQKTDNVVGFKR